MERPSGHPSILGLACFAGLAFLAIIAFHQAYASCPEGFGPLDPEPNVTWTFKDSVAACPAGDSLVFPTDPHKPSQLRIVISYFDANCDPKVGVPPESIYVTATTYSGNATVNDQPKIYADDSTNSSGQARVTIRSMSGAGKLKIRINVSGALQGGYSTPTVRTIDTNADGRVTSGDATGLADINYNGSSGELEELARVAESVDHWHRHVLFGTPVRRTNLAESTYGYGRIDWEPNGHRIGYSVLLGSRCKVFLVESDPTYGNTPKQFTWPANPDSHDYNPNWSPRGHEIAFDREDRVIYRKGVPGLVSDTSLVFVVQAAASNKRTIVPAFSPNGRRIAYTEYTTSSPVHMNIYVVDLPSGTPQQLTRSLDKLDVNARWSPDAQWIYFDRSTLTGLKSLWRVKPDGSDSSEVLSYSDRGAALPSPTPDGTLLLSRIDIAASQPAAPHMLELVGSALPTIPNYAAFATTTGLYPTISPDGTRTAFVSSPLGLGAGYEQVWAVRRNMDLPPTIATIGDKVVEQGETVSFTVSVSDPEGDPITRAAYFLESGMSFTPSTGAFSWTPGSGTAGNSYWVKFVATVASGGNAAEVVKISVIQPGVRAIDLSSGGAHVSGAANPSGGSFMALAPGGWKGKIQLVIYDLRGRVVAESAGRAGEPIVWDGKHSTGTWAAPGVYFYELRAETARMHGKWVVVR